MHFGWPTRLRPLCHERFRASTCQAPGEEHAASNVTSGGPRACRCDIAEHCRNARSPDWRDGGMVTRRRMHRRHHHCVREADAVDDVCVDGGRARGAPRVRHPPVRSRGIEGLVTVNGPDESHGHHDASQTVGRKPAPGAPRQRLASGFGAAAHCHFYFQTAVRSCRSPKQSGHPELTYADMTYRSKALLPLV